MKMPKHEWLKKVMVIGSGPIIIGQAAEFDYAGSQACRSLREEGIEVVLLNSNPATIMTDTHMADRVYIEPLTWEYAARVMAEERPQGLLPTLGGQTGLNIAVELAEKGVLEEFGIRLLGTPLETIKRAEDREFFKRAMESIGEPVPPSAIARSRSEARELASVLGLPLIIRPAYTLGGSGGGIARTPEEFEEVVARGLKTSPAGQVLIEKSVLGYKEIEYEVMRDARDNCIVVCNMENIDPMGVHTGDSVVVAPSQTLSDEEYQMLRRASIKIIRALGVEGGCNIQFALDPWSREYYVIEVNPRVSRSSALASKATGYPIAKVAAKIAIGLSLDEIRNPVTGSTTACFEPTIDYVVIKVPRWPFDKFQRADRQLGTQMKATGEVMAIDRTFEGALNKALRSLELDNECLWIEDAEKWSDDEIQKKLEYPDDQRLFAIAESFRRGYDVDRVARLSSVDPFFLAKIRDMVEMERKLKSRNGLDSLIPKAKRMGFSDSQIAKLTGGTEERVRLFRIERCITPTYKIVDTCAAEFAAQTPYYYSSYDDEDEGAPLEGRKAIVLGAGPIRIGQGIEFDYCCVHSAWSLASAGWKAIMINNNPETVSTDFDTADRLYFEPLTAEDVLNVVDKEKPTGVIVQCGGQTAINLCGALASAGVRILGTPPEAIDTAEDRKKFDAMAEKLGIPRPPGGAGMSVDEALAIAERVGFPVLVRPSYVLGGRAMEIVYDSGELQSYMKSATKVSRDHPVLVDRYIAGTEVEVDAVSDGERVLIAGIMEHLERAGVHSGDSIAVYPAQNLEDDVKAKIVEYTVSLARGIGIKGFLNIQMVVHEGQVYVLEVNPRASRTVPFMSKVTGIPLTRLATEISLGARLDELGYGDGLYPTPPHVAVKMPVFSWAKLFSVDTSLGPEMKSTGEVMGIAMNFEEALAKAFASIGFLMPKEGNVLATIADRDKEEMIPALKQLDSLGYKLFATAGTAEALRGAGVQAVTVRRITEGHPNIVDLIRDGVLSLVLNTLTKGRAPERDGFRIRRAAAEFGIPCFTACDTAKAAIRAICYVHHGFDGPVLALQDYLGAIQRRAAGVKWDGHVA